jgi:hypothetical protein
MKSKSSDTNRAYYLELCEKLLEHAQLMRNFAMKPGNVWLARAELGKISALVGELETILEEIHKNDEES